MKIQRNWLGTVLFVVLSLFFIAALLIKPIDRSQLDVRGITARAQDSLTNADVFTAPDTIGLRTAFAKIPLTPPERMPMAGYAPRASYDSIHDPLFIRIIYFNKAGLEVYFISADLLIFPPLLRDLIMQRFGASQHFYFTASHTHSSLGGWDPSFAGGIAAGKFQGDYWSSVADNVTTSIKELPQLALETRIEYFEESVPIVKNRLSPGYPVDEKLRGVKLVRQKKDSALLYSFSGHPTLISRKLRILSADYPGETIDLLNKQGYQFSLFAAGMMGSHSITGIPGNDFQRVDSTAAVLNKAIQKTRFFSIRGPLKYMTYELPLPASQMRISKNLAVRNWLFTRAFGGFQAHLTFFQLGSLIFVSTPCDFSGELMTNGHVLIPKNSEVVITSFNGDYIGYITEDMHYDTRAHAEVRTMNWVGPHFGDFMSTLIGKSLAKIADH